MNPPNNRPPWKIVAAVGVSLALVCYFDYITGYQLTVSLFYLIPIILCGWYCMRFAVVCTALLIGIGYWVTDKLSGHIYTHESFRVWNSFNRFAVFAIVGLIIHRLRFVLREQEQTNQELKKSLEELSKSTEEIRKLQSGLQTICAWTKRIKVGEQWVTPEEFLRDQLHLKLTHTISPEASHEFAKELKEKINPPNPL
jgi:K+-sensing histidine kinase KdpD